MTRTRLPALRTLPSTTYWTPNSRATAGTRTGLPLWTKAELREITSRSRKRDSSVMMSSVRPSAKNSCSGSPLMLANGSTAIEGLAAAVWRSRLARVPRRQPAVEHDGIGADRPGDVLDRLLAEIREGELEPGADLLAHRRGDADAAGLGQGLEARGDVDAVAEDVVALDDHVAEIDADAELDPARRRHVGVAPDHALLDLDRALDGSATLWNSTSMPSPVVLMIRPLFLAMEGSISSSRCVLRRASVPVSSASISRL